MRSLGLLLATLAVIGSPNPASLMDADIDGDGRLDRLVGQPAGYCHYTALQAVLADGRAIPLPFLSDGFPAVEHVQVINMPGAVVVTTRETGGSVGSLVEAFTYDPKRQSMVRLNWNDEPSPLPD